MPDSVNIPHAACVVPLQSLIMLGVQLEAEHHCTMQRGLVGVYTTLCPTTVEKIFLDPPPASRMDSPLSKMWDTLVYSTAQHSTALRLPDPARLSGLRAKV